MSELDRDTQIRLEEYKVLNAETLERIQMGERTINLLFVAAAAVWAIGTQNQPVEDPSGSAGIVFLLYPYLAFFMAAAWASNAVVLAEIGVYIRDHIEKQVDQLQWATHFSEKIRRAKRFTNLFVVGTFVGTQSISILVYFQLSNSNTLAPDCMGLLIAGAPVGPTMLALGYAMRYRPENHKRKLRLC